jgi:pimeloyl-ACP methyl ester carboxylesterase
MFGFSASVAVTFIAVAYVYINSLVEHRHSATHEQYRKLSNRWGEMRRTRHGDTHVVEVKSNSGSLETPVVLLHGISISSMKMLPLANEMSKVGFRRVITYDHYGRGHSAGLTNVAYDADLYVDQLNDVLQALSITGAVHVVALSMGGAVAASFAARHPSKVASVSLLAPGGVPYELPFVAQLLNFEPLGRWLIRSSLGILVQESRVPASFVDRVKYAQEIDDLRQEAYFHWHKPGFAEAMSSTVANFVQLRNATTEYTAIARHTPQIPVALFWGDSDQ